MRYIDVVAEVLDVKIGEKFKIISDNEYDNKCIYSLNNYCLLRDGFNNEYINYILRKLFDGIFSIIKVNGEIYTSKFEFDNLIHQRTYRKIILNEYLSEVIDMDEEEIEQMNHMKEIATMLDVELNEPFDIINVENNNKYPISFCLSHKGLTYVNESNLSNKFNFSDLLQKILIGEYKIIKKLWKPIDGEIYWMIKFNGKPDKFRFNEIKPEHLLLYKINKIYRSYEEAKKHSIEDKDYWNDIHADLFKDVVEVD